MEPLIRKTADSVQLTSKVTNCPSFFHDATAISAKGKSANMPNASQCHYFAIHLACLKNSIELDAEYLQKKSTLNPKSYNSTLQFLLQTVNPASIIGAQSIAKYYGSPEKLKQMIEDLQSSSKDTSPLAALAAAYQITQLSGLKTCGTIGAMAALWAQPADLLKEACTTMKTFCDTLKIKEAAKGISEEIRQSKALRILQNDEDVQLGQKRSRASARSDEPNFTTSIDTSSSQSTVHPLLLFNCSCNGPAFGPIIL